jgi:hypothetical protein|tara:strand:+ start:104 stop:391 length:288 start_codon:yes stop_codon:yes gene_type:complete
MSEEYKQMSKKDKLPLKYACVQADIKQHISQVLDGIGNSHEIRGHIDDLYKLIEHQMLMQLKQESQMTAIKHLETWKRYDKSLDSYDPESRSYKK